MALGSLEVQIFVSLAVILIAGFIALIVDYLKGANETLRVQNAGLRARQEERDRLLDAGLLTYSKPEGPFYEEFSYFESSEAPEPEIERDAEPAAPVENAVESPRLATAAADIAPEQTKAPQESLAEPPPVAGILGLPKPQAAQPATVAPVRLQPVPLASPANGVLAGKSGLQPEKPAPAEPPEAPLVGLPLSEEHEPAWADIRRHADVLRFVEPEAPPPPEAPEFPKAPFVMPTNDFPGEKEQQERRAEAVPPPPAVMPGPVLVADATRRKLEFPAGLHTGETLEALLKEQAKMEGLVLLVGVNNYEKLKAGREAARQAAAESVAGLMRTVVGAKGFAAPRGEAEYVIVFPGETGAEAYRRVRQVTERLWDYQLRSLAQDAVTFTSFSWGTAEVISESLSDAIAAAAEQMNETRRMRSSHLAAGGMRSRAVNL
jgi:hypothetical protein